MSASNAQLVSGAQIDEAPMITILLPCLNEVMTLATCIGKASRS